MADPECIHPEIKSCVYCDEYNCPVARLTVVNRPPSQVAEDLARNSQGVQDRQRGRFGNHQDVSDAPRSRR